MPRGIPNPKNVKRHYFLVSGEIEYVEIEGAPPKYMKVNAIHVSVGQKLAVKDLSNIQTTLQLSFHNKYLKSHNSPPTITDAVINSISYLGVFTQAEFHNDEEHATEEKKKEEKPELKVVKAAEEPKTTEEADKALLQKPDMIVPGSVTSTPAPEAVVVKAEPVKEPLVEVLPTPVEPKVEETIAPPVAEALKAPVEATKAS